MTYLGDVGDREASKPQPPTLRQQSAAVIERAEQLDTVTGELKVWVHALVDALEQRTQRLGDLVELRQQWAALAQPRALAGLPRQAVEASVRNLAEELLKRTQLPCPHGRPSWQACPHCLGVNRR